MSPCFLTTCILSLFLIEISAATKLSDVENIVVSTRDGDVRGIEMTSESQDRFLAFRGIPYAEAPVGALRFKPPVPKKPWKPAVFNATVDGPMCPQIPYLVYKYMGVEDCLIVNVYTPKLPQNESQDLLPVMAYIHGGGFVFGDSLSNGMVGPNRFMRRDIVFVTFHYRLNALGFLSTEDAESPGNYGLLDQLEALKWVNKNIQFFGGNPNRVTLFGQSAGGASVLYQLLSPLSEGLVQRFISLSGSPLCSWGLQERPLSWAKKLSSDTNCSYDNTTEMVECLRQVPVETLVQNAQIFTRGLPIINYGPSVDGHFLKDTPLNLFSQKHIKANVSLILGGTNNEGGCVYIDGFRAPGNYSDEEISDILKIIFVDSDFGDNRALLALKTKFFSNVSLSDVKQINKILAKIYGDGLFNACLHATIKVLASSEIPTFVYSYDYKSPFSVAHVFNNTEIEGVCHVDDLFLLFGGSLYGTQQVKGEATKKMQGIYRTAFTNFAKTGNPTPDDDATFDIKWEPIQPKHYTIYHFDAPLRTDVYNDEDDPTINFWMKELPEIEFQKS